jgi:DNA-binding NtrC family response regulator
MRSELINKPTLLIVDDEKPTRDGLRAALEDHYEVWVAEDAKAAMTLLEQDTFAVMLTDFRLPQEDGMKLMQRAKSLPKPPICILMTAYGSEELAVEAMKQGADDYIAKGRLQIDELEMRIARAIERPLRDGKYYWRFPRHARGPGSRPTSGPNPRDRVAPGRERNRQRTRCQSHSPT